MRKPSITRNQGYFIQPWLKYNARDVAKFWRKIRHHSRLHRSSTRRRIFLISSIRPPHLKDLGKTSWMAKKYGVLPNNWEEVISKGFHECMRVLKPKGTLIFKWNEHEIKTSQVLNLIPYKPLFGHTSGKQAKTIWMAFIKESN